MKKLIVALLLILTAGIVLSSCASHGARCPGMYSETQQQEVPNPM